MLPTLSEGRIVSRQESARSVSIADAMRHGGLDRIEKERVTDHRFGRIMNANIAEYHVPVNADVHDFKVIRRRAGPHR
jgi:xanthine dehydrogenase YagR molybdenum-binding subunit